MSNTTNKTRKPYATPELVSQGEVTAETLGQTFTQPPEPLDTRGYDADI